MIDEWFLDNIEEKLQYRRRVVVLDPTKSFGFLIKLAEQKGFTVLETNSSLTEEWQQVQEELFLRYEAEKNHKDKNVVFYTTRPKDKLSFLFDYCFTHGSIDFSNPIEWLRNWLFKETGLQITLDDSKLITAAKLSMGKDVAWWKKILQGLEDMLSVEEELLPFLNDPNTYLQQKDSDIRRLFEEKIFELIGQPYSEKPPETLAKEFVNLLFLQLLNNEIQPNLLDVYHKWLDSTTYSEKLFHYAENFKIPNDVNIWNIHPEHCFSEIDRKQLIEIARNFRDKSYVTEKLKKIKERISKGSKHFVPDWWQSLITLVECNTAPLAQCDLIDKITEFYTTKFHKADRAIRKLYVEFLNDKEIIRPIQEYYESLNSELLARWFEHTDKYKSNQNGYLVNLIKSAEPGIAIIVGDGLRYEIADYIASKLKGKLSVEKKVMFAGIPSETEHNMSALYSDDNEIIKLQKDREMKLVEQTGKTISFLNLEALNYGIKSDYLVLTYKDIDSAGEKLQLGALKLFDEFEKILTEKIELLIKIGYREVYVVTDHGFVLTGLLEESDKIEANATGKKEVHERYIRTVEKQHRSDWIEFEEKYVGYNYVYVAKNHRPFKSIGVYGFSHGGFTPQEVIIPNFVFKKKSAYTNGLQVFIANKGDLQEVTGENFGVKIRASEGKDDLFSLSRKIQVLLYANNINFSSSNIINIERDKEESFEFSFGGNREIRAVLIDADTKEQLDYVDIKKSIARDLDGLL